VGHAGDRRVRLGAAQLLLGHCLSSHSLQAKDWGKKIIFVFLI
jgi:hypothetical protein